MREFEHIDDGKTWRIYSGDSEHKIMGTRVSQTSPFSPYSTVTLIKIDPQSGEVGEEKTKGRLHVQYLSEDANPGYFLKTGSIISIEKENDGGYQRTTPIKDIFQRTKGEYVVKTQSGSVYLVMIEDSEQNTSSETVAIPSTKGMQEFFLNLVRKVIGKK